MTTWPFPSILNALHADVENRLSAARKTIKHSGEKGGATEAVWLELFQTYLPKRYEARPAFVVDSKNGYSEQIDIVVHDRQYSPFVFTIGGKYFLPAESVYAVFEAKQAFNLENIAYAQKKVESVRRLHRTSLPISWLGGKKTAKKPHTIVGGILALDSEWEPKLGKPLRNALAKESGGGQLDIGCAASHGLFTRDKNGYTLIKHSKAATVFLLETIARLQALGTVPMLDVREYSAWLKP
jgi:hypothetical protein